MQNNIVWQKKPNKKRQKKNFHKLEHIIIFIIEGFLTICFPFVQISNDKTFLNCIYIQEINETFNLL